MCLNCNKTCSNYSLQILPPYETIVRCRHILIQMSKFSINEKGFKKHVTAINILIFIVEFSHGTVTNQYTWIIEGEYQSKNRVDGISSKKLSFRREA